MDTYITFRLNPEQKERFKDIAWRKRMDTSQVLRKLVEDYVKRETKRQERQEVVEAR